MQDKRKWLPRWQRIELVGLCLDQGDVSPRSGELSPGERLDGVAVVVERDAAALAPLHDLLLALLARRQVDGRRLDRGVAEEHAHVGERRAGPEQLGRARVAQRVRVGSSSGSDSAAARASR